MKRSATHQQSSVHLLIVEDDPMLRQYLEEALGQCGYDTHAVINGEEARQWLHGHAVDLVLTDVIMPDHDGIKLVAEMKRQQPEMPVVVMSGRGRADLSVDSLSLARAMGADATLEKPFSLQTLERTIAFVLSQRH